MSRSRRTKWRQHNDQIMELQADYLETGSSETLGEIYLVFEQMAANMLGKFYEDRGISCDTETRQSRAADMASLVIEQYLKREDFQLTDSPSGYLRNGAFLRVVYGDAEHEQRTTSLDELTEKGEKKCQSFLLQTPRMSKPYRCQGSLLRGSSTIPAGG